MLEKFREKLAVKKTNNGGISNEYVQIHEIIRGMG
jgi:hypothetical protein